MSSTPSGEVLRCQKCNKPFDQETTLKRHGYYCRTQTTPKAPRSRACQSCVKAKARCDNVRPNCSRCLERSVHCHYPPNTSVSRPQCPKANGNHINSLESRTEAFSSFPLNEISDLSGPNLDFDSFDVNVNWNDFSSATSFDNEFIFDSHIRDKKPLISALFPTTTPFIRSVLEIQRAMELVQNSIPPTPPAIRSFNRRMTIHMSPRCARITNNIFSSVTAFPIAMVRDNTLPPFVHGSLQPGSGIEDIEMEPIFNCLNLLHMAARKIRGSRKLFWRSVRMECEQMCHTHAQMSPWYLLTGLQAVSLYTLVRIHEGPTDDNNVDSLLLATILTLYQDMVNRASTLHHLSRVARASVAKMWRAWMFEESVRRLGVLYHVLHQVVYWDAISHCRLQPELLIAPLPARKDLWDARDETSWFEARSDFSKQAEYGLGTNGELIQLMEGQQLCAKPLVYFNSEQETEMARHAKWESWASEMDELGNVVVLAAELVAEG